jgi:hypothetical protein
MAQQLKFYFSSFFGSSSFSKRDILEAQQLGLGEALFWLK